MFAEQRKIAILSKIEIEGSVRVDELAEIYKVTEATIRRDLQSLEENGFLKRTHGGAVLNDESLNELTFFQKKSRNYNEKKSIGLYAASLVKDGETIAIDTSTTTLEMIKYIKNKKINVLTNSVDVIEELIGNPNIQVISTGGIVRGTTRSMVGPIADMAIKNFIVDKAFMGANAIDVNYGIACTHIVEVETKKCMISIAKEVIFLCESSKFDQIKFSKICGLNEVDFIITDKNIKDDILEKYKEIINVVVAE